jgi:endonuclease/exonuclease/phosphatase family metal-dependent hydrolase
VVPEVGEDLRRGLDEILVVAVALLRVVPVADVVGPLGLLALTDEVGLVALEKIELPRDHVPEAPPAKHVTRLARPLALLVRTWNVFHGNADPPERRAFLEEMVRLATADHPDVVCLQEVPVWALSRLEGWSGMRAFGAVAARPLVGSAELGRVITDLNHGLFRSAFTGQANAILLQRDLRPLDTGSIVLNPRAFRSRVARELGLDLGLRLRWAKERRVCHAVRTKALTVANLHGSSVPDWRVPDAELLRAATFADSFAEPDDDALVLAGDFNVIREHSRTLEQLSGPDWGFTKPISWIDQILVRGVPSARAGRWPPERRRLDGRLLSDHAPVEVTLG